MHHSMAGHEISGLVTAVYAAAYTFLKYFKAWAQSRGIPLN